MERDVLERSVDALRTANPDIAWTSFVDWAQHTFESGSRAKR
jgi:hypothetical protein